MSIVFNHCPPRKSGPVPKIVSDEQRIIAAFTRAWHRQLVATGVVVVAGLAAILTESSRQATEGHLWGQLFCGVVFVVAIFSFFNYRCPACQGYLGRTIRPPFCPHCGVRLR